MYRRFASLSLALLPILPIPSPAICQGNSNKKDEDNEILSTVIKNINSFTDNNFDTKDLTKTIHTQLNGTIPGSYLTI